MKILLILLLAISTSTFAVDFDTEIRPLLQDRCVRCHGAKKNNADLRLDAKPHAFQGGESGPAIVAGNSAKSLLYQRIVESDEDVRMPPDDEPLSAGEIAAIKQWIDAGALWPENQADRAAAIDVRLQHWAFQPLAPTSPAETIDSLIERKLAEKHLTLSPAADPPTLIRRLCFDLTGLPPTPQEVERFVQSPGAYESVVDGYLGSPRFGEKWARHWLDVVRFAESDGYETNRARANAWPYRDYVIASFNEDSRSPETRCRQMPRRPFSWAVPPIE